MVIMRKLKLDLEDDEKVLWRGCPDPLYLRHKLQKNRLLILIIGNLIIIPLFIVGILILLDKNSYNLNGFLALSTATVFFGLFNFWFPYKMKVNYRFKIEEKPYLLTNKRVIKGTQFTTENVVEIIETESLSKYGIKEYKAENFSNQTKINISFYIQIPNFENPFLKMKFKNMSKEDASKIEKVLKEDLNIKKFDV